MALTATQEERIVTENLSKTPLQLAEELDRATRALTRAGFTLLEGAQEWKPPIGQSASPLLDRIYLLGELLAQASTQLQTVFERDPQYWDFHGLVSRIDTALVGNLRERSDTEWTDADSTPTAQDYRELQAQHDQMQSKYKAALDVVRDLVELPYSTGGLLERLEVRERARDLLAGQVPDHTEQPLAMVPEGWQLEALDNDCIVVRKDGVGFYVASFNAENIASTILHALASDMLAAAHKPEGAA